MEIKKCIRCKIELKLERKTNYCTTCKSKMDLESYHRNKEKRRLYQRVYEEKHPDKVKKSRQQTNQWIKNNPGYMNKWQKEKRDSDVGHKIKHYLRERIRLALKANNKINSTINLLGCTLEEFKKHLESKFTEGMNWGNYGKKGWHVDHIKPCSSFDLSKEEEQRKCFHYTNLQPLWWYDNLKKSNKNNE